MEELKGDFEGKHIISFDQFDPQSLEILFALARQMRDIAQTAQPCRLLEGNLVTLLFYEPSSRTMASFDGAVKQLGGNTIVVTNPQQFSSVAKGETFVDTIRTFEAYCDAIVLRHPETGSAKKAANVAKHVPVINAGDCIGEHPTQALLDLFTILEHAETLAGLKGLVAGDLLNGRTVHSLLKGLALYPGNTIYLLAPHELRLSPTDSSLLEKKGVKFVEIASPEEIPADCNFWYWTRVQKERFPDLASYEQLNNRFVVTQSMFDRYASDRTILMHPLPRVGEIEEAVDEDPRAVYLRSQIRNGMYVRMALLSLVLGKAP
jgi:aspartate carbamoyltransferase